MNTTTLHSKSSGSILYTAIIPPPLLKYVLQGFSPMAASGEFGDFLLQKTQTPEAVVWYNNYLLRKNDHFKSTGKFAKLELQFCLNNTFAYHGEGLGDRELHDGSFNLVYTPSVNNQLYLQAGRIYTTFEIHFTPELLQQLCQCFPILNAFLDKVAKKKATILCTLNQLTTNGMTHIIGEILRNKYEGGIREIYVATKVMELLIVVLEKVTHHPTAQKLFFREDEIQKIYEAKEELLKDLDQSITLQTLSRKVGLNMHKLKTGFFQFYGSSVTTYRLDARMKEARLLLDDTNELIESIGFATGYVNTQHFAKVYKKYFGLTPAQQRKDKRQQ